VTVDGPGAPLLTVVVPAYQAEAHLGRALEPLGQVPGIEVVVVDDGSTDHTAALADAFARRHPGTVRVLHQRNAGHGGAINAGVAAARGTYLKVLDADDRLDPDALAVVLATLADLEARGGPVDVLVTDYVRDQEGRRPRRTRFDAVFPRGRTFGWDEARRPRRRQVLMMHALVLRTDLLRASGLVLPERTSYVDSLVVVAPLVHARRLHYLAVGRYRYTVGRAGQSVDAAVMVRRVDEQVRVNRLALAALPSRDAVARGEVPARLDQTLVHYVEALCAVTSATLARGGTAEHLRERAQFWEDVRREHPRLYRRMRRGPLGASANLPGRAGRRVTRVAYVLARRVVGFG
jgi:hypothetical protein